MTTSKPRIQIQAGKVVSTDSLSNMVANIGTNRDKRTHNVFGFEFVNQIELEAAYQSNCVSGARSTASKPRTSRTKSGAWVCSKPTLIRAAGLTCTVAQLC